MKKYLLLALGLLFSGFSFATSDDTKAPTNLEIAIDRPGADYTSFTIQPDYRICKNACESDSACQAFTYVHPGVQGPSARCWLKSAAPGPVSSGCCYSGVKQITTERGWDRPGGDYTSFNLPLTSTPETCAYYCRADTRCRAYTFVQPNLQGPYPRCWLKNTIPALRSHPGCVSGAIHWR